MKILATKTGDRRNAARIIVLVFLCLSFSKVSAAPQDETPHLTVFFQGTETTHTSYYFSTEASLGGIQFGVEDQSGWRIIAQTEGWHPSLSGVHHDQGLTPGDYLYRIRTREFDEELEEWGPWQTEFESDITIDGISVWGTLLFDDEIGEATLIGHVTIPNGKSLTIDQTLIGEPSKGWQLNVYGDLVIPGALIVENLTVHLYKGLNLSDVTGGVFHLHDVDFHTVLYECSDMEIIPYGSATITSIDSAMIDLNTLSESSSVTINDSSAQVDLTSLSSGNELSIINSSVVFVQNVTIPNGADLLLNDATLSGTSGIPKQLHVHSGFNVSGNLYVGANLEIHLYQEEHLSLVTGGVFFLYEEGSSFNDSNGVRIFPTKGGEINGLVDGIVELSSLTEGSVLNISNSSVTSDASCSAGEVYLDEVIWQGLGVRGRCTIEANNVVFSGTVTIGESPTASVISDTIKFISTGIDSHFIGLGGNPALQVWMIAQNKVSIENAVISGGVDVFGGFPSFENCEFSSEVTLKNRNGASFQNNLFLGRINFINHTPYSNPDAPYWHEGISPTPDIHNNAFIGQNALFAQLGSKPTTPIPIGPNYYGDKGGCLIAIDALAKHGFLGYYSGHAGALCTTLNSPVTDYFAIAPHLETSPVSVVRRDTSTLPSVWINGYIYGQNTVNHSGAVGPLLQGRETLLSVHVVSSDNNLSNVRVYAKWGDQGTIIEAYGNRIAQPLHRDQSLYQIGCVRRGHVTYDFILPGLEGGDPGDPIEPVWMDVYVDRTTLPNAPPDAGIKHLLDKLIYFDTQPERELRIYVQPIEIRGLVGGSWGKANPMGVIQVLQNTLPEMLPIPAEKVDVTKLPTRTFWAPLGSITAKDLLARIAAGVALARKYTESKYSNAPDFIVVVLPKGFAGDIDGATYAQFSWTDRILFVAEHKPDAVFHELGHGIGEYVSEEQYDTYPPNGLPVERATVFHNEGKLPFPRIDHVPGQNDFWYDYPKDKPGWYYLDIMGNATPHWAMPNTVQKFYGWFKANLKNTNSPSTSTIRKVSSIEDNQKRILFAMSFDGYAPVKESLHFFDVTDMEMPEIPIPPTQCGSPSNHLYYLSAYDAPWDAAGNNIYYSGILPRPCSGHLLQFTLDLPTEPVDYCISRLTEFHPYSAPELIHCVRSVGLQSTQLVDPQPGDPIDSTFEATFSDQTTSGSPPTSYRTVAAQVLHALFYKTAINDPWSWALMTDGPQVSTPSSFLPDTDYLAFRLVSSDGTRSVEHEVSGLEVLSRPPQVTILNPTDGAQSRSGFTWHLFAYEEDISGTGLQAGQWSSSIDGILGEGSSVQYELSEGTHMLRYEVMDNNGLSDYSEVTVSVHEVMDALDLALNESDLSLYNESTEPPGFDSARILPGKQNILKLLVRNQGVEAAARVRMYIRGPGSSETLLGELEINLEPFENRSVFFDFEPEDEGEYLVRAIIDQVDPQDPNVSNNERTWTFSTTAQQSGLTIYLPVVVR